MTAAPADRERAEQQPLAPEGQARGYVRLHAYLPNLPIMHPRRVGPQQAESASEQAIMESPLLPQVCDSLGGRGKESGWKEKRGTGRARAFVSAGYLKS